MTFPVLVLLASLAAAPAADTTAVSCGSCEEWNQPQAPFRLFGETYFVGVKGLSSVLIATPQGSILIDGALPQSVPLIVENLAKVGHRIKDVKWILSSHAHYDHVGGVAALARLSGARVAATASAAAVLRAGMVGKDDPQWGFGEGMRFPPVRKVMVIQDGARIRLGGVTLTMHQTPGHTPGGSSWTWRSCAGERCADLVYADSLNAVSAPGFRFADDPARVAQFRRTIERVGRLPCDLLVAAHPHLGKLFEKQAARSPSATTDPMLDPQSCRTYADQAMARLDKRLGEEAASAAAPKADTPKADTPKAAPP